MTREVISVADTTDLADMVMLLEEKPDQAAGPRATASSQANLVRTLSGAEQIR
jgi:hypothetical protein